MNRTAFILLALLLCGAGMRAQTAIKAPGQYPEPELPRRHEYHQTLWMKLFLSSVDAEKGEGRQVKKRDRGESKVDATFEQALEIIRKTDNLTLGIPKIVYLVGWQYNGHDSKYPAWAEVNPLLKRPQDATALESMKWLMKEALRYNTTVSVHINMFDAYDDSPLWDAYVAHDIIARNADGTLRPGEWGWPVSYTQEWKTGYAQKRIDGICEMLSLAEAGTVHIDAFHSWTPYTPDRSPISPYLGYTTDQESETQKQLLRYWASKGVDVTSEGSSFLRISSFEGLQPAAWWYAPSAEEYMAWPASYYCGGTDSSPYGRLFGSSMHGEEIFLKDPQQLSGFLYQFCTKTLPWYYLNRLQRLEYIKDGYRKEVKFSQGVITRLSGDDFTLTKNGKLMQRNSDVFIPALWRKEPAIVAYSADGYVSQTWDMPEDWTAQTVDIYKITLDGLKLLHEKVPVKKRQLTFSLAKDEAGIIVAHSRNRKERTLDALSEKTDQKRTRIIEKQSVAFEEKDKQIAALTRRLIRE
ncbi:MAG: endo-alpha-N-acetylgalactosaminidase family protein [Tannerella sp.]|jgi:hypothetical protein|nr:endo-alpha-N-acetylgalactosaminidase family protein [Tannerella sp.]